jgi:hypothetical protein
MAARAVSGEWKMELDRATAAVVLAARAVADGGDTGDGMVEVKWDEMVRLRDALRNLDRLL